jgi:hypothetical protein
VINLKAGGIAAGAAFILSFLLGLLSGAPLWVLLLRAFVFGAIFFALVSGAYFLISRFMPELLEGGGGRPPSGSLVNITLDDGDPFAGGEAASPVLPGGSAFDAGDELGDISALMGGSPPGESESAPPPGIDQTGQDSYNEEGLEEENPFGELLPPPAEPDGTAASSGDSSLSDLSGTDETLPDLDAMAGAFGSEGELMEEPEEKAPARRPSAGGKPAKVEGDFNPKDMATAVRDRLKRE